MEASKSSHKFSIDEAVSYGWETTKKNLKFLVLTMLIMVVISFLFSMVQGMVGGDPDYRSGFQSFLNLILEIISTIIQLMFSIGLARISLAFLDGHAPQYAYLWDNWSRKVWHLFLSSLLYGLMVLVGLILLVIPGIILALKFQFYVYFIVEKNMGPLEALKASSHITKGNLMSLFLIGLVQIGIVLLGLLVFVVGLFIAYPITLIIHAYLYRKLSGGHISPPKAISSDVSFTTKAS